MKEFRILLNESTFTQLCKTGFFSHKSDSFGSTDIHITKTDMKEITTGKILVKQIGDDVFKIALQDIGLFLIKEILRRSPVYSEMANDINF